MSPILRRDVAEKEDTSIRCCLVGHFGDCRFSFLYSWDGNIPLWNGGKNYLAADIALVFIVLEIETISRCCETTLYHRYWCLTLHFHFVPSPCSTLTVRIRLSNPKRAFIGLMIGPCSEKSSPPFTGLLLSEVSYSNPVFKHLKVFFNDNDQDHLIA